MPDKFLSFKSTGCRTKITPIVVKQMGRKNAEFGRVSLKKGMVSSVPANDTAEFFIWYLRRIHQINHSDLTAKLHWLQLQQSANHMLQSESKKACPDWLQSKPSKRASCFSFFFFFFLLKGPHQSNTGLLAKTVGCSQPQC